MSKGKQGTTPNDGELIFGKYKTMEEAHKGWVESQAEISKRGQQNQLLQSQVSQQQEATKQYQELLARMSTQAVQPSVERQQVGITDADGDVTADTAKAYIDSLIAPIQQTVGELPNAMRQTLTEFMRPYQVQNEARNQFFGQDFNTDKEKFASEMPKFLMQNPGINKSFEMLSSNSDTANQAYDFAFQLWQAKQPSAPTAIDEAAKAASGNIPSTPGPPATLPGESINNQELIKMGIAAGESFNPQAKQKFMAEWMKGTKIEAQIEQQKQDLIARGQLPGE